MVDNKTNQIWAMVNSTLSKFCVNPLCPRVAQKQHKSIVHFGREILKMYLKFLVCIASHSIKIIKKAPFLIFTSNFCPISILFGYVHQFFSMLPHSNKKEPVEALLLILCFIKCSILFRIGNNVNIYLKTKSNTFITVEIYSFSKKIAFWQHGAVAKKQHYFQPLNIQLFCPLYSA